MRATQETLDLLTEYFAAMEAKNASRMADFYEDDVSLNFANAQTITGRDAVVAQMVGLLDAVDSLAHPLVNVWQEDGGVVILEVDSVWRFHDQTTATVRACSIFTVVDGRFTKQRIYVDNAVVDAKLAE